MRKSGLCLLVVLTSGLQAAAQAGGHSGPGHGPDLPQEVVGKLTGIAREGLDSDHVRQLRDAVVEALSDIYRKQAATGGHATWQNGKLDGLWEWLGKQDELRCELVLAVHPRDNVSRVFAIVDQLRAKFPREVAKWPHLTVAFAVVWDNEKTPQATRDAVIWGEHQRNAVDPESLEASFEWLAQAQQQLTFRPEQLRWPFLVYVADNDCTVRDRRWALAKFSGRRRDLGPIYSQVPYDDDKLAGRPARIGEKPTTLPNLLDYGGVCAERAYFTSRVCKTFGVPAAAVTGTNRFGGRHAWVGYFGVTTSGGRARPDFCFHGRYRMDHYYVGSVLDPQTLQRVSDRDLALLFDGAAEYARYEQARLLWRVAHWIDAQDEKLAIRLLCAAVEANPYFGAAWRSLADKVEAGTIAGAQSQSLLNAMLSRLGDHPDLTLDALEKFLASIPDDRVEDRSKYYDRAYRLYGRRPDLQARLRLAQGKYLTEHGQGEHALRLMGATALANAKEAIHILPLATGALDIYREKKWFRNGIRFGEALLSRIPKARQGRPSSTYLAFCREFAEFCEDAGQADRAAKWNAEAESRSR